MRSLLVALTGLTLFATGLFASDAAQAKIAITVDKDTQTMTVAVDGVERYQWPVSTGNPSHETPNGTFRTFRMEEDHYSKEFDDAPMPHSIFFTKVGHAIHGTESESRLGTPVSHGCVRLSRANASTLYAMVEKDGVLNTTVTLTGSSQVALARNPRTRAAPAVSRRDPASQYSSATRRWLHLSGRRQFGRRALSRAAWQPASLQRTGLPAAAILRQSRLCTAIRPTICAAALLPAARAVSVRLEPVHHGTEMRRA